MSNRPRGRVRVYTDSLQQRVVRHITLLEAHHLVDTQPNHYEWVNDADPQLGVRVKTTTTPLRPQIGDTISKCDLEVNAGVRPATDLRVEEVRAKLARYHDTGLKSNVVLGSIEEAPTMPRYCTWPRAKQFHEL